ncbi:hypothetical protein GW879_00665, partial [Candidatus Kaiserbacteria bacterium]|nr:hypothetical protein [Candidatus Kaiserbacteria bacterium]
MFSFKKISYLTLSYFVPILLLLLVWSVQVVSAAEVLLAPSTGSFNVGQTFTSVIKVSPGGANVNAVEASLKFDP